MKIKKIYITKNNKRGCYLRTNFCKTHESERFGKHEL